jgi:hypothetical protein
MDRQYEPGKHQPRTHRLLSLIFSFQSPNSVGNRDRYPTVKWSGIQNALEESHSDVLIILDCCASGMSNTDEGSPSSQNHQHCYSLNQHM